jgi:repressor LexA
MKGPTNRQQAVLAFIAEYINEHTYPPTIRELGAHFSISVKGAHDHVTALKKKGLLKQGEKKSRTMELVTNIKTERESFVEIPILGTVAAGTPILAEENLEGVIRLPRSILKKTSQYFALKVRGDSMEGEGIMDGDTAVIEQQSTVQNGEIAVVWLDNEEEGVTIKTFYKESNRIRLQPSNPRLKAKYYRDGVKVLGRLAHIIRSYGNAAL